MLTKILKDNVFEKIIIIMFLLISVFLLSLSMALGQVSIDNIDVPASVAENTNLTVSFTASTDTTNNLTYVIYHNGVVVSNTDTAVLFMNYSSSGNHLFTFFAGDIVSNASENQSIIVTNVPLAISLITPVGRTYNTNSMNISAHVSTYADYCFYYVNNSMNGSLYSTNGQDFYGNVNLSQDGRYLMYVSCYNVYDTINSSVSFITDTINPVILSSSYSIDSSNVVTISAVTDSVCTCKYDISDKSYDLMSLTFTTTNNVQHSTQITGLYDGSYVYYIKCKDVSNNIANTGSVSFSIVTKPSASISLSKSSPLKAGTYEVRLETSKPVVSAPSLYYNFNSDVSPRYVTLTGSGTNWKGYLIIGDSTPNMIGSFHYSATDSNNNVGSLITGGEIFLVDTTKPSAPTSFEAASQPDGNIKLKWYYDGEDANRFNIYRATNGNPDYVDYYDSSNSNQYIDHDVIDGVTYYYRIAAVDSAENDGVLSEVIQGTSSKRSTLSGTGSSESDNSVNVNEVLDQALAPKVDQFISDMNVYLEDIASARLDINQINDPNKLKIINTLKLLEQSNTAQVTIKGLIEQAKSLKNQNLKQSDLDVKLNKLKMDAIKAKSLVAEDIIVNEQSSYNQVTQESDVVQAISELVTINLSKEVLDNYSLSNKKLQDGISVDTDISIFKIKYLGKDDYDKYTLVKKVVSSSSELNNIVIIEIVPKSFERLASDIIFDVGDQQKPVTVKDDPVLRWDVDKFNKQTIYYLINSNAEMSSAKDTKTLVLYRPDFKVTQTIQPVENNNKLTGFLSLDSVDLGKFSPVQWLVVLGIGMILGLSTYYVSLEKKEKRRNSQRLKEHRIITKPLITKSVVGKQPDTRTANVSDTRPQSASGAGIKISPNVLQTQLNIVAPQLIALNERLDKANTLINNFDYENARILYNECMIKFNQSAFKNPSEKSEVKLMLEHLFLKLTAYRVIYSSRKHVTAKNYSLLKQDIDSVKKIYMKLYSNLNRVDDDHKEGERKFIDYVANSKRHLEGVAS